MNRYTKSYGHMSINIGGINKSKNAENFSCNTLKFQMIYIGTFTLKYNALHLEIEMKEF